MSDLGDLFLTGILAYGAWGLGLVTLVSAIGVPMPATMILLATGAFVQQGVLGWESAASLAIIGAVLGDNLSYLIGRFGCALAPQSLLSSGVWRQAKAIFSRWGALAIFLSRFLITPLALPINLMAGGTGYKIWRYFVVVVAGEVIWVIVFIGAGYLFADRWEALSSVVSNLSGMFVGLVLFVVVGVYLIRSLRFSRS